MTEIQARFEFRAFGQTFGSVLEELRRRSPVGRPRESDETYVVSRANNDNNTKIRFDTLDIKVLVARERGLEQWSPRFKCAFPLTAETIGEEVFPAFGLAVPELTRDTYTLEELLREIVAPHDELQAVSVFKQRVGFEIRGVLAEWARVLVNGAAIQTVCLESVDADALLELRQAVGAQGLENVNYLLAIKRVIGMEPLPAGYVPVFA